MGIFERCLDYHLQGSESSDLTCIDASLGDSLAMVTLTLFQGQRGTDSIVV